MSKITNDGFKLAHRTYQWNNCK